MLRFAGISSWTRGRWKNCLARRKVSSGNSTTSHTHQPAPKNISVTGFQCNVKYLFQFRGAFPASKVDNQWREQVGELLDGFLVNIGTNLE